MSIKDNGFTLGKDFGYLSITTIIGASGTQKVLLTGGLSEIENWLNDALKEITDFKEVG